MLMLGNMIGLTIINLTIILIIDNTIGRITIDLTITDLTATN